jgi:CHAT domain-containing protein
MADLKNKIKNPRGLSLFLREINECNCIDDPKYLRYYTMLISGVLNETETYKWASKALSLIDKYKLNYTEQGINIRIDIAKQYAANNNTLDALKIYNDIFKQLRKNNLSYQEIAFMQTLYGLGEIYLVSNKLDKAKIYVEELQNLNGVTALAIENMREYYKYSLKMRYLFRSKEYLKHKIAFESLNLKDKHTQNVLIESETDNYVLSKYFLDKNIDETIESLNDLLLQKPSLRRAQLLFEFQLTKNPNKPNTKILIDALHEEYKSFNVKADFLNRSEFVNKISKMQFIIDDISNFLPYLSSEDLSGLIELKNYINTWKTNRSKRQTENEEFLKLDEKINNYRRRIEQELEKVTQNDILIDSLRFEVNKSERMVNLNVGKSMNLDFMPIDHYISSGDIFIEYIQTNGFYYEITNKYWGEPNLLAVVLSKNETPEVVNLGKIDKNIIDNLKDTYNSNIQLKNTYEQDEYVWNYMIQPLYVTLSGFDNIYVKNTGALGFINIEAIHIPETEDLMVDRFKINRVDAVFKMNYDSFDYKELESIGIYGNPDFESHKNQNSTSKGTTSNNRNTSFDNGDIKLSYLTGAKKEIKLIEKKAADFGISSKLYDFTKASESNFKADNDYDVIHIATHAYDLNSLDLEESNNTLNIFGLDKSQVKNNYFGFKNKGLFFAGSQNTIDRNEFSGYMDNGILNGNEITNMEFNGVKLVVLSACNTIDSTGKGFTNSGLDRAFLIAGAQEVLATLWDIDDLKTREFMGLFYENYFPNRSTALEALNKTKEQFRILNPEPYYWAPFVIVR